MTLSSDNATSGSGITNRRRFIGGTAAAATGLWAAPKVMATAAAPACSTAPRALTLSARTQCGDVLSSEGPTSSGTIPGDTYVAVEGCSSCAGGNVIVRITRILPGGEETVATEDPIAATGNCETRFVPADVFTTEPGPPVTPAGPTQESPNETMYVIEAFFEDEPAVSASISWVLGDCEPTG